MKVKICGITHPSDAVCAADAGADFLGIVLSKGYKRTVTLSQASAIIQSIHGSDTRIVGIFIGDGHETIQRYCHLLSLSTVQLHGLKSQSALPQLIGRYDILFSLSPEQHINPPPRLPNNSYIHYDSCRPGCGISFDWNLFSKPKDTSWILSGGLNPDNVKRAIMQLMPDGVDVSSGIESPGSIRKDHQSIKQFIKKSKAAL